MATLRELQQRHKEKAPKRVLSRSDIQTQQNIQQSQQQMQGNAFAEQEPTSFLGKARDVATNIIGGGELARGAGQALAASESPIAKGVRGLQSFVTGGGFDTRSSTQVLQNASERTNKIGMDLANEISQKRQQGEDTSQLENALAQLQGGNFAQDALGDFAESLPSNRQVIGSAARLGALAGGGALARGAGSLTGVGTASSIAGKAARGAGAGILAGGAEGAVQGAGIAAEQDASGGEIALGGALGSGAGAALGGALGGATGAVGGALAKRRELVQQRNQLLTQKAPDSRAAKYVLDGQGRVASDPSAREAIKQGVDEGSVALYKGSSQADKQKMLKMLDTKVQGMTNKRSALINRPEGVVGETVMDRFNTVASLNKQAAKQLDDVAKGLKGNTVDPTTAAQQFVDDMSDLGVSFRGSKPVFDGSDIEKITPARKLVEDVAERMKTVGDDAFELHRLKRFIDERVAYGKAGEGLSGNTERIVKALRRNIDEVLDTNFPEYNNVNTQFSKTREAIDAFGDVAGKTFDATSPTVNENAGNLMRRITSNARSRTDVLDALNQMQDVAQEYGKSFDDDVITQVDFVSELENLFGSSARTSLQGQIENVADQATQNTSLIDLGLRGAKSAARAARDINEEALERSLRELLK